MSTSYTFETLLFGLTVEVQGEFSSVDDGEFEVKTIKHKGECFEVDSLQLEDLWAVEQTAFHKAEAEAEEQSCQKLT